MTTRGPYSDTSRGKVARASRASPEVRARRPPPPLQPVHAKVARGRCAGGCAGDAAYGGHREPGVGWADRA
eukprot:9481432-Pyramimonas_sp.AAC.1